jgi:chromatin modification-related protein VID21
MPSTPGRRLFHRNDLPPEMTDVALFHLENKHIRDRLYAGHQFKPPAEFPMPSVSFFESRQSSQWLWEEDQKLRTLVKDYSFNWSLVAQELALPSIFVSGSGRRTPWECFERWMLLEGLPSDMGKLHYFKTYMQRLEQAQKTVAAEQQQMLQQQAQQGQNVSGQVRKRSTQPIRVERRRENRHLAFIDAMRKLARKREQQAHKQAECKLTQCIVFQS